MSTEINIRNTTRDEMNPSVALSRNGGAFVAAYQTSDGMEVSVVSSLDTVTSTFNVTTPGTYLQSNAALSIDSLDRFFLTFDNQDDVPGSALPNLNIRGRFGQL